MRRRRIRGDVPVRARTFSAVLGMWLVFTPYAFLVAWNVHSYLNVHTDLSRGPDSPNTIGTMEVTYKSVTYHSRGAPRSYRCFGDFTPWSGGPTIEVAARQLDEEQCVEGERIVGGILVAEETTSSGLPWVNFGDGKRSLVPQVMGSILLLVLSYYPLVAGSWGYSTVRDNIRDNRPTERRIGYWEWRQRERMLRRRREAEQEHREQEERVERERLTRISRERARARKQEFDDIMARIHAQTERDLAEMRRAEEAEKAGDSGENGEAGATGAQKRVSTDRPDSG